MARDTFEDVDQRDVETRTDSLGNALVIFTTVVLVAAIFLMQKALKDHFNAGMMGDRPAVTAT